MSQYTYSQHHKPSPEEIARWKREERYFAYQTTDGNAPTRSSLARGWGVPAGHMPPIDAFDFVSAMFKRDVADASVDAILRPEFRWSVLSVCMAHFLWFRTPEGAKWVLSFFGVEEVPAFHDAYAYFYLDRTNISNGEPTRVPIDRNTGMRLRIFRSCENTLTPPVPAEHSEVISVMQSMLREVRDPNATEAAAEATPDMYFWVSERIRDWFIEPKANPHWPTHKANRITGGQWVRTEEREPGILLYEAIRAVELYKMRAYRVEDQRGAVKWCSGEDIRFMLRPDHHRLNQTMSEHHIQNTFQCSSCAKIRPCTPVTKNQKMCCSCFGGLVEKGERPTLNWCTMSECRNCTDHLESKSDLTNLKYRLNREATFPVNR